MTHVSAQTLIRTIARHARIIKGGFGCQFPICTVSERCGNELLVYSKQRGKVFAVADDPNDCTIYFFATLEVRPEFKVHFRL